MIMKESCPGSREIRSPYPEEILCVFCGARVEIWSDETETTCKKCAKTVSRDMKPSCLEWCPAAKECVGIDKYEKIMKKLSEQNS
jgi:predicted amidophosphoribosyltransferase